MNINLTFWGKKKFCLWESEVPVRASFQKRLFWENAEDIGMSNIQTRRSGIDRVCVRKSKAAPNGLDCFPHSSVGKESACSSGDPDSIPGLGRSPREGKGCPLQYSGVENSRDYSPWGRKELDTTDSLSFQWLRLLPRWLREKNPPADARDTRDVDSIPESTKSLGGGNINPLQYSRWENSTDRGAWWAIVHEVTKNRIWLSRHHGLDWQTIEQYAAAAAKSHQSWPTLCHPIDIDSIPPGSPVPGILQTRTLEWAATSFSNEWKGKVKVKSLSPVQLFTTPWTVAYQAPPSMGFSRQEDWSGCHCLLRTEHYRNRNQERADSLSSETSTGNQN